MLHVNPQCYKYICCLLCQMLSSAEQTQLMLPFVTCTASVLMQETSKDTRMNNLKQRINNDMKLQSRSAGETSHCALGIICSLLRKLTQEHTSLQPRSLLSLQAPSQKTLTLGTNAS